MRPIAAVVLACSLGAVIGCGERPAPPPPAPVKPASLWSTADAQAVAKELAEDAARQDWVTAFRTRNNRPPRILVDELQDRSGDHVDIGELAAEIEHDLAQSQQVEITHARPEADFVLGGAVGRESMPGAWRYTVDLRLVTADGDPVWVGGREREVKAVPAAAPAAPAAAAPAKP